jgi:cytidine deaminase
MSAVSELDGPEIFLGLVGAVGTDLTAVSKALEQALISVNYSCETVRLSELMHEREELKSFKLARQEFEENRIGLHMDAGNRWRELTRRGDALALLAMAHIQQKRVDHHGSEEEDAAKKPIPRTAYLLRSLKHPEEVKTLREVYGSSFLLISAYCPRESRMKRLAERIANSHNSMQVDKHRAEAEKLLRRDQSEPENPDYGQNVRDTFPLGDVFVDASQIDQLAKSVRRFVELIFGYPFHTPTRDEQGMFYAQAAALRSSDLSRQVGAAICTANGSVLASGTNEAPKSGGGLYWPEDSPDCRDFKMGRDTGAESKKIMLMEILEALKEEEWLQPERNEVSLEELYEAARPLLSSSQLMSVGEFGRCVHAEMAAITDAARRGVAVENATLHVTTFPCHNCAKHIVASGIHRVVYIEPYPKSQAAQLYDDSIAVDMPGPVPNRVQFESFVGIAPRLYMSAFQMAKRRGADGRPTTWDNTRALPTFAASRYSDAYVEREDWLLKESDAGIRGGDSPQESD